ncbi:helix-turn-helix transcriptional regulator [Streptomyces rochei]|uniref:helix-turn-helix transcriptional regulator n=1 Tax=Streptomyces rochei TaxID=1928 RepID=UPI0036B0C037
MSSEDDATRAGPGRPEPEDNVAARIKLEREARGWSTVTLAERMAEIGHPINQSAIWRIESGKPRRRVNLDEALGFCKVFDISMSDLTGPPLKIGVAARQLIRVFTEKSKAYLVQKDALEQLYQEVREARLALYAYAEEHPEQQDDIEELLRAHEAAEEEAWVKRTHPAFAHLREQGRLPPPLS